MVIPQYGPTINLEELRANLTQGTCSQLQRPYQFCTQTVSLSLFPINCEDSNETLSLNLAIGSHG
jgi:hypothetical protein